VPAISDAEHQKFLEYQDLGHKLLKRGKELADKGELTEGERREFEEIQALLKKIDQWFADTSK
jgi:hypothetical protein